MPPLQWESRPDGLRAPALVCAFKGWNDAGDAASAALSFIGSSLGATRFATIDPEEFFDFQATRPKVRLLDGRTRSIEWPDVEIYAARVPRAPRDLVLLQGPEPSLRWKGFCRQILDLGDGLPEIAARLVQALPADDRQRAQIEHVPDARGPLENLLRGRRQRSELVHHQRDDVVGDV